ncbi:MAG: hypothetical protein LBD28_03225, partial [Tannerellaceae bacterium]|nr:hypothetical protein [Tannerellaceae bacterium]
SALICDKTAAKLLPANEFGANMACVWLPKSDLGADTGCAWFQLAFPAQTRAVVEPKLYSENYT